MQPTYLPWAGYFNLMTNVDLFVFLDDAQFQKNSWHSRNRLLLKNETRWITVPVRHKALEQMLTETEICEEQQWRRKHANMLCHTYARHPCKNVIDEIAFFIINDDSCNLAVLNSRLINYLAKKMGITTKVKFASAMHIDGFRTERVLKILHSVSATEYLSPVGAAEYLESDGFSQQKDVILKFSDFNPMPYTQYANKSFIPYLSVVDLLANLGWHGAYEYVLNLNTSENLK